MRAGAILILLASCAGSCRTGDAADGRAAGQDAAEEQVDAQIRFEGNTSFDAQRLERVIAADLEELERRSSLKAAVDDAAYSVELFYRAEGFPGCRVDYRLDELAERRLRATLLVEEGPRVAITGVEFTGLRAFSEDELRAFFAPGPETPRSGEKAWFVERGVLAGLEAVEVYYRAFGFLDVQVRLTAPDPRRTEWTEEVLLEVTIDEGPRYVLRAIEIQGGVPAVDAALDRAPFLEQPLTPRTASTLRGRLRELYGRQGYPDARVDTHSQELQPNGDARIALSVAPGERVTIERIEVRGNERTKTARVLDNLELEPGERYDLSKERQSFRNLYSLGVFSKVGLELEGTGEGRVLRVDLEEAPSQEFFVEPGWGSYERLRVGLGWRERNLMGTARALGLETTVSELAQQATAKLTDPRFLDSGTMANLALFADRRVEPSFTSTKYGSGLTFARRIERHLEFAAEYAFRRSNLDSSDIQGPPAQGSEDDVNISSIRLAPSWDTRDSAFSPRTGTLVKLSLEYADEALGSQLDFLRPRWSLIRFQELGEGTVLGLSWRAGLIAPFGSTSVIPIQELYFNGGENTVRSFEEDQLGPVDVNGNPVGGEAFNVLSAELRQRLQGRWEGALFFDTGNVASDYRDYLLMEDFRSAIGAGLRYNLPVGPLRLDAAWNPDPTPEEADWVLHFAVGLSF